MSVVDLEDMKKHLNITRVSAADPVLQSTIDEIEAAVAERCGPLEPTTITKRIGVAYGKYSLVLPVTPVIDITSVTPYAGAALDVTGLYFDPESESGVVTRNDGGCFPMPYVDVVYRAGRLECPKDLIRVVKETVQEYFEGSALRASKPGTDASDTASNTVPGAEGLFSFRSERLMQPHLQFGIG